MSEGQRSERPQDRTDVGTERGIEGVGIEELAAGDPCIGRYVRMVAHPGKGAALADALLHVADNMRRAHGCQLYLVNLAVDEPDTVWVTELWSDIMSSDLALGGELGQDGIENVMVHLAEPPELIALRPLGGAGYPPS